MPSGGLEHAVIVNNDKKNDSSATLTCMFNPEDFTLTLKNKWTPTNTREKKVPFLDFAGSEASDMTVKLIFDTYEEHSWYSNSAGEDVRNYTRRLEAMMYPTDPSRSNVPPTVSFQWGSFISFTAVITSLTQRFTLFLNDGTPVRAEVDVTFKQCKAPDDYPATNPTSGAPTSHRVRTVYPGDSLANIAYEEYGTTSAWRHIADVNRIDDPRRLTPGMRLRITPLTDQTR